ncbi:peptidylprolyl isomerase [Fulvivirgaceae bacterium BMA10]|uniref:Peptidylprolyl isomerase n=1 Tax=Splendidivirga corallicola TaxID=3051826 RepID=A0ABT8KTE3_9BACT|nr:peptidylprolyl isomerase [Fulvivirgaceae bacterium BMA10]
MTLKYFKYNPLLIRVTLLTLFLVQISIVASAQSSKGQVVDKIIAKIDNYIILKSELEGAYIDYLASGQPSTNDLKCRILESLITNKVLVAKAEIDSVVVSDEEVESMLERKLQYFISQIGSEERIEQYYGKTIQQFRDELKEKEKEQLVVRKMQETISENISVTPAEVELFFKSIPRDSLPFFSKEVTVGQIVKVPSVSESEKLVAEQKLSDLRQRILNGEDFGTLAKQYSEEPAAQNTGGDLGFQPRGALDPKFEAAALSLKPGEISKPIESSFGIHIIQLVERRGNLYNSRHIILIPKTTQKDIDRSIVELDSIRNLIVQDSLTFEQAAKELSDDQNTSSSGGYFLDAQGSNSISVKELDPTVYFAIDTMTLGAISKPVSFRQPDGKEAVRIFYYKSSKKPHQANMKDDYQKLYAAKLNQKRSKAISRWFSDAKQEVFINIDEEYDQCNILK